MISRPAAVSLWRCLSQLCSHKTLLLSGFIFPVENMPRVLQWLCDVMPPKYFITIIRNVMLKGAGIMEVWKETLVLTGMLAVFLGISAARFKVRLQ
jgi:ABC-2 type transport system permease protein